MEAQDIEVHGLLHIEPGKPGDERALQNPPSPTESAIEKHSSHMEEKWRQEMCHQFQIADRYTNVAAVIIRWADELDNLHCDKEAWDPSLLRRNGKATDCLKVEELNKLFRDDFEYKSSIVTLNVKTKPQGQLNYAISHLIRHHDGPHQSHLLIVYYSGHGIGDGENELTVAGTLDGSFETDDKYTAYSPTASWNKAEADLDYADSDVLTVLDCCSAAYITQKGGINNTSKHEVLAASGRGRLAEKPGPGSFTRHFIDAMREELLLHERRPFSIFDLNEKIMRRRKCTDSHVYNRHAQPNPRHISLAPLNRSPDNSSATQTLLARDLRNIAHIDLRVNINTTTLITEQQTKSLAQALSEAARTAEMGICAIDWLAYRPSRSYLASLTWRRHLHALMAVTKLAKHSPDYQKRKALEEPDDDLQMAAKRLRPDQFDDSHEQVRTAGSEPPTPSPSSLGGHTPQH